MKYYPSLKKGYTGAKAKLIHLKVKTISNITKKAIEKGTNFKHYVEDALDKLAK